MSSPVYVFSCYFIVSFLGRILFAPVLLSVAPLLVKGLPFDTATTLPLFYSENDIDSDDDGLLFGLAPYLFPFLPLPLLFPLLLLPTLLQPFEFPKA